MKSEKLQRVVWNSVWNSVDTVPEFMNKAMLLCIGISARNDVLLSTWFFVHEPLYRSVLDLLTTDLEHKNKFQNPVDNR